MALPMNRKVIIGAGVALGLGASAVAFGILAYGALKDLANDLEFEFTEGFDSEEDF